MEGSTKANIAATKSMDLALFIGLMGASIMERGKMVNSTAEANTI